MTTENTANPYGPTQPPVGVSEIPVFNADEVRKIRLKISMILNSLVCFGASREISLIKTNLQQARHWFGDMLNKLGAPAYSEEEHQPDKRDETSEALAIHGDVKGCAWLREEVGVIASRVSQVASAGFSPIYQFELFACFYGTYQNLKQARFWLGEVLAEKLREAESK